MICSVIILLITVYHTQADECSQKCSTQAKDISLICGFDRNSTSYKMFPSTCAMAAYSDCYKNEFQQTPLKYCIMNAVSARRMYGESCPLFCPSHYRPVCAAPQDKFYSYRTFNNGCWLDMVNCRGGEDSPHYIEVPLEYCPNHGMKNIFKERVIISNYKDYGMY